MNLATISRLKPWLGGGGGGYKTIDIRQTTCGRERGKGDGGGVKKARKSVSLKILQYSLLYIK